jgi:hypothetical protein
MHGRVTTVPVIPSAVRNLALGLLNYAALGFGQRRARFLAALRMRGGRALAKRHYLRFSRRRRHCETAGCMLPAGSRSQSIYCYSVLTFSKRYSY